MKLELILVTVKLFLVSKGDQETYSNIGNNLTSVPSYISRNVHVIILSDNKIEHVSYEDFQNFNDLMEIDLTSNKITRIGQDLFSPSIHSDLAVLKFSDNVIEAMPIFDGFNSLKTLDVSNNLLQNLTLGNLDSVENLYVFSNKLDEMPVLTNTLATLKVLKIEENNITTIPKDYFVKVPALEKLDLKLNHIREINLEYLTHLSSINLFSNELQAMPRVTETPTSLETMILDSNEISQIPNGYFNNVPSLLKLIMSDNPLITFNCSGLFKLKELRLNKTSMNEFPNITDCFRSLEKLYFEGLKGTLEKKGIEKSLVFGNTLIPIQSQSFKRLELRQTYIGDLPSWFLFSLPNLEFLDIATTELTEMPDISTNTK